MAFRFFVRLMAPGPFLYLRLACLWLALTVGTLAAWLGLTVWVNRLSAGSVPAAVVFNYLAVTLLVLGGLPLWHRALYRWCWHLRGRRHTAGLEIGSVHTASVPVVGRTTAQRVLYTVVYLLGMGLLMLVYGPLGHQSLLVDFLRQRSVGSASFGSLSQLLAATLPMYMLLALTFMALRPELRALARGETTASETLRLRLKHEWLLSFMLAFGVISLLCFFAGLMTLQYLR